MVSSEDLENLSCDCDDPNNPGHKLFECGSQLCKFLKGEVSLMGVRLIVSEEKDKE